MGRTKQDADGVRLDQWLHAARFFKTRALAAAAIKAHRVLVNESRVKPARAVRPGDRLRIVRGLERRVVDVIALSRRRGPAKVAQTLYEETPESIREREELAERRRLSIATAPQPERRPDKRARRRLIRFQRESKDPEAKDR